MAEGKKLILVDGYVDEPSAFGVPPYISPHARYAAGAAISQGGEVEYHTIDSLRARRQPLEGDALAVLASCSVPGKYLRGVPITHAETVSLMRDFHATNKGSDTILFGDNAAFGFPDHGGGHATTRGGQLTDHLDHLATRDGDALIRDFFAGKEPHNRFRTMDEWNEHALLGAPIVAQHPDMGHEGAAGGDHPNILMAEMDTFYGCVHYLSGGCNFCSDAKKKPWYRPASAIIDEAAALYDAGVRHFRLGGQTCFWTYDAIGVGQTDEPKPNVEATVGLLAGVSEVTPERKVLHIDNANPAVIATWPDESAAICQGLVDYGTDGNIAAFGLESADPAVFKANNLNATPEQTLEATRLLNKVSGQRGPTGLPFLLPGINLLYGLPGETKETYEHNWRFVEQVRKEGLKVRRIQIRQLLPIRGQKVTIDPKLYRIFRRQKEMIRDTIDKPVLQEVIPAGTLLRNVFLEKQEPGLTLGRQIATYALLVGIPYETAINRFVDVLITDHGPRSITGIPVPFHIPSAGLKHINALPGIGKKRAAHVKAANPQSFEAFAAAVDDEAVSNALRPYLTF